ncbi:YccF domain-containing protein [Terasakiella sp. SH-1]|uniref:YccF domain-containing protein n=1 Tax=Terasakiella sp. SH-1 TaxID=2560057 RepID=UPI00142FD7C5|nr:YccF domain-containing protein [Terasakiella sp. SH-1]
MLYPCHNEGLEDIDAGVLTKGAVRLVFNLLWFLLFGIPLVCIHATSGLLNITMMALIVTIPVALPNAMAHFKMTPVALFPIGKRVVRTEMANYLNTELTKLEIGAVKQEVSDTKPTS